MSIVFSGFEINFQRLKYICDLYRASNISQMPIMDNPELKEQALLGVVVAWSVITLESLANHAIAQLMQGQDISNINDAIENPRSYLKARGFPHERAELVNKINIINTAATISNIDVIKLNCENIADFRNDVVHDKPYLEAGGSLVIDYRKRGSNPIESLNLHTVRGFLSKCEVVFRGLEDSVAFDLASADLMTKSFDTLLT